MNFSNDFIASGLVRTSTSEEGVAGAGAATTGFFSCCCCIRLLLVLEVVGMSRFPEVTVAEESELPTAVGAILFVTEEDTLDVEDDKGGTTGRAFFSADEGGFTGIMTLGAATAANLESSLDDNNNNG